MTTARRHHRRRARARDRGAVLHAPARRPRRARDQGRAAGRGRLRARLRRAACSGLSSHFVWTNRSKESLTLDLKHAEARGDRSSALLARADVLVQNLAPGAAARMGLSYEALRERIPRLIVCDISGYGDDPSAGPYRDKKAYDLLIQSEAGLPVGHRHAGRAGEGRLLDRRHRRRHVRLQQHPRRADRSAAAPAAARASTSRCWRAMVEWMGFPLYYAYDGAAPPPRSGAAHATIYPYGPFPAGDGKRRDARPAERARVAGVLRRGAASSRRWPPTRASPPTPRAARTRDGAARASSSRPSRALSAEQVVARLDAAQIANARVNTMAERLGASAAAGARALAPRSARRPGRCRRCCRRARSDASTRAWTRCRRSAQHTDAILRRARARRRERSPRLRAAGRGLTARERDDDVPVRGCRAATCSFRPTGRSASRKALASRRRRGHRRPRGRGGAGREGSARATRLARLARLRGGRSRRALRAHQRRRHALASTTTSALVAARRRRRAWWCRRPSAPTTLARVRAAAPAARRCCR